MTAVVVGGGITGLVAARRLRQLGIDVIVLEEGRRPGGKIATLSLGGALVEGGPDWFVTRRPEAIGLC
ncbi:MAG TPA: FAD-dependent oxidoreductase, partial [Actinomycetota bacterium]|nr:FAD-dependent oxidoreductase [Actinomycetota bacterium]